MFVKTACVLAVHMIKIAKKCPPVYNLTNHSIDRLDR